MVGGFRAPRASVTGTAVDPPNRPVSERHETFGLDVAGMSFSAPVTNRQPIAIRQNRLSGSKLRSFYEDFYNQVYVIPAAIEFGSVSVETKRQFYIWNAYRDVARLTEITATGAEGTRLDGLAAPRDYRALELRGYDAVAAEDGPADFLAVYEFAFDRGGRLRLTLAGERARLLPFLPNWREPYMVSRDFKTEVIVSRSGREQRRALRQTGRKTVEFTATSRGSQLRAFNRHMRAWQNRVVMIGEETKFALVIEEALPGSNVLRLARVPEWAKAGVAVFVRSDFASITTEIDAVVDGAVVLTGRLPEGMPVGAYMLKGLYGRIQSEVASDRHTASVAEHEIAVDVTPGTELVASPTPLPVDLDGRPVFTLKPNWGDVPKLVYAHPRETLDYDVGRTATFSPVDFASRVTSYLFSGRGERDVREIENLFDLMRGQAGEFYYPSWEHDLPFDVELVAGTRTMQFLGSEMFDAYGDDPVHRAVMIRLADGTFIVNSFREDPVFSDGKTIFTFKHDWPRNVRPEEPVMTCWLFASRFATDRLTVEWLTREVATVKTTFTTLEDLPYEL